MGMSRLWVGLDLGESFTDICVTDDEGAELRAHHCETGFAPLHGILSSLPAEEIELIGVEAGNQMHLVRQLRTRGYPVAIFEARKAHKFLAIRRSKTDRSDAKGLADLARLGRHSVSQVHLKSVDCQRLRSKLVLRHKLVRLRVAAEGALRSRFTLHGQKLRTTDVARTTRANVDAALAKVLEEDGIDLSADLQPLIALCESMRAYVVLLDKELAQAAKENPVCRRLMGVPGVGPICSLSFYTAIEDPERFIRAADVGSYLGLAPRRFQSGETSRTLGITKTGSTMTRSHLVTSAMIFRTRAPECALKAWSQALHERLGGNRARIALARKLAVVMLTMWKNGTHFESRPSMTDAVRSRAS